MGQKPKMKPEALGTVQLYRGQVTASLVREGDPDGTVTVHARRNDLYVHEQLVVRKSVPPEFGQAGEAFRKDFERAGLNGQMPAVRWEKVTKGREEMSEAQVIARERVRMALGMVGAGRMDGALGLSQSCCWFVIGDGATLEQWAQRVRSNGLGGMTADDPIPMNAHKASGILIGVLERLALHYRLITPASIRDAAEDRAFRDAAESIANLLLLEEGQYRRAGNAQGAAALHDAIALIRRRYCQRKAT